MSAFSRAKRVGLGLAYIAATVLAQLAHDHGRPADPETARAKAHCDSRLPHVADDSAPRLDHPGDHCPSCQFRASHQAWLDLVPSPEPACAELSPDRSSPSPLLGSLLRPVSRAPPRA
jgi:hypothetical protein